MLRELSSSIAILKFSVVSSVDFFAICCLSNINKLMLSLKTGIIFQIKLVATFLPKYHTIEAIS
jgi:hypothetical protein